MTSRNDQYVETHHTRTLLALLAGAGAGLAAGILLAPKSGGKLRAAVNEYLDVARQKTDKIRNSVAGAFDTGALEINSVIDQTVAAVNNSAQKGHDLVNGAADSIRTATRA